MVQIQFLNENNFLPLVYVLLKNVHLTVPSLKDHLSRVNLSWLVRGEGERERGWRQILLSCRVRLHVCVSSWQCVLRNLCFVEREDEAPTIYVPQEPQGQ